ncbi:aspartate-semialdehyde dehydrogenase [Deinococcus cellulosilyticus]|uniref:Aspartate-semialdehyde dehydrogenase n=1 Tax=Deinococcus cellulosilyticus (strain DSM 18568 / NBRC 106333 / KACC 11606 / 5516J-15) TaxID=1223518 RepID=A0A511N0X5_DEIC1|nr:aspartate-semialdehyde dehydrogenase [Deinococcus cellulosilyticus]GEM46523.1 aspartate-semialdehyde dehydrogenase [Deinococcus cellulosilyticus NBRC 106333 = KACC 11606]
MRLAIVGATGAVGHEFLRVLENSPLQFSELRLYASPRSAGSKLTFKGKEITVEVMPEGPIAADVILASAGGSISKTYAPVWVEGGAVVIDNSSAFRYDADVPLVVPEINGDAALKHKGIIANPNCTTAIAAVAVYPLHQRFKVKRMIVSTYQATSGAGAKGMDELLHETRRYFDGETVGNQVFAHPIPFNLIPHIDSFQDNGYTKEEMKVVWETHKIFGDDSFKVSCTAVRIPTLRAHSEAITLELEKPATPEEAREILSKAPGVQLVDDPGNKVYPMPLNASGKYDVEVGRIRASLVFDGGLELFVSGDQLLKGAALNAVQIAEYLQAKGALPSGEVAAG